MKRRPPGGWRRTWVNGDVAYIELTRGFVTQIDVEDLPRVGEYNWCASSPHTRNKLVYAVRAGREGRKQIAIHLHRVIMNAPPHLRVDHRSLDTMDNRKSNLRLADGKDNCANKRPYGKSGFKGVHKHKGDTFWRRPYRACIGVRGKQVRASFATAREAAEFYDAMAVKYFGEFALTNRMLGLLK